MAKMKIDYLSTLFVGIDIGSRENVVTALNFDEERIIKAEHASNSQPGAEKIESLIIDALDKHRELTKVIIALESTGMYGVHLANYLSTSDKLAPFSQLVYCVNPKEVANYKKSYTSLDKNDDIDSCVIADFARVGRISIQPWKGAQYLALQRLTRQRHHMAECLAREKTYMLNNVFLKFSEFALLEKGDHPFSNKYGATAEAILTDYMTCDDIINASTEDLVQFIHDKSRGRISEPEHTAELLQSAARNSYRLDKCLYDPLTTSIACSFNCISAYEKEMKAVDDAILKTVKGLNPTEYQILLSVPGIGPVYAAGILAEIGSISCFPSNDALANYCGIVWKENQSGKFEAEDTPMNKAGNTYLRYYIIEAVSSVINYVPEYRAFYERKCAETRTHQRKRALALTSRKLIRMLYGLLDKGQLYSPGKGR